MRGAWIIGAIVAVVAGGCDDGEPPPRPPIASAASAFASARRPARTVYAESVGSRCDVYWLSGETESERKEIRCPRELKAGERLRLTGRTCHRESVDPQRRGPVRCSPYMLYVEDALHTREGEFYLRPRRE